MREAHLAAQRLASLSTRERETLDLLAHGLSNAEIAKGFVVSETTDKSRVALVLMKLGGRDRSRPSYTRTTTDW